MTVVDVVNIALSAVTLAIKVGAFGDAAIRPSAGFKAVDKMPKLFWLIVLGLAVLAQVATAAGGQFATSWNGLIGLIGVIVALIYLFAIRPQVIQYGGRRGRGGPRRSSGDSW